MAKSAKTRNVRRNVAPSTKSTQMSLRTRRLIFGGMAVVLILMMLLALAPQIFGAGKI